MGGSVAVAELCAPITHAARGVPDATRRSAGDAKHRPLTPRSIRGTDLCAALLTIAARSGRCPVLESPDDRREDGSSDAATGHLADDAADIRRRGAIGEQRNH